MTINSLTIAQRQTASHYALSMLQHPEGFNMLEMKQSGTWNEVSKKLVYLYLDPYVLDGDIYDKCRYVGIGDATRFIQHWKGKSHNDEVNEWTSDLKKQGFKASDVVWLLGVGYISDDPKVLKRQIKKALVWSQSGAAEQETLIIDLVRSIDGDRLFNRTYYWVPDRSEITDSERMAMGDAQRGVKKSEESVAKKKKAQTNSLVLDLYKGDKKLHRFKSVSCRDIAKFILDTYGDKVNAGNLWQTIKPGNTQGSASGYKLKLISGELKSNPVSSMAMAIGNSKPALLRHGDDRVILSFSYQHKSSTTLGYDGGAMGHHLKGTGCFNGISGWTGRFLTDEEVKRVMHLSPIHYEVAVDGVWYTTMNLNAFSREHGFDSQGICPRNAKKAIYTGTGYVIANNKRVEGRRIINSTTSVIVKATPEVLSLIEG